MALNSSSIQSTDVHHLCVDPLAVSMSIRIWFTPSRFTTPLKVLPKFTSSIGNVKVLDDHAPSSPRSSPMRAPLKYTTSVSAASTSYASSVNRAVLERYPLLVSLAASSKWPEESVSPTRRATLRLITSGPPSRNVHWVSSIALPVSTTIRVSEAAGGRTG